VFSVLSQPNGCQSPTSHPCVAHVKAAPVSNVQYMGHGEWVVVGARGAVHYGVALPNVEAWN
jgi:hypothetical protein